MEVNMIGRTYAPLASYPMHSHNTWELVLHQSGMGITQIGDLSFNFSPGFITLCPPGVKHSKTSNEGSFEDIFIAFSDYPLIENLQFYTFYDDADKKIENLLIMALTVFYQKNTGWHEICSCFLTTISHILFHQSIKIQAVDKTQILQNEIIRNFTNPEFHIETAMEQLPYSKDHLRRCFKKELGMNPLEYLTLLRLNYAKSLLQDNSNYSVKDVAWIAGFYDTAYFSRLYRKHFHICPSHQCKEKAKE